MTRTLTMLTPRENDRHRHQIGGGGGHFPEGLTYGKFHQKCVPSTCIHISVKTKKYVIWVMTQTLSMCHNFDQNFVAIYFCQYETKVGFDNISKIYFELKIVQPQKIITFHLFDKNRGQRTFGQSCGTWSKFGSLPIVFKLP